MTNSKNDGDIEANGKAQELTEPPVAVSFAKDIAVMFTPKDKSCMGGMGIDLGDYAYMSAPAGDDMYPDHANANHVYARLTGDEKPQMPLGGEKKWNAPDNPEGQKNLKTFHAWMTVEPTYQP